MSKKPDPTTTPEAERPRRMTLSQIVELLLSRTSGERSTVSLVRNAKGDTQIEVTVRTGEDSDVVTVEDAERKAKDVYDRLHSRYPANSGHDNAGIAFTRNAKGETQIAVEVKTGDGSVASIEEAADKARDVYTQARARFPVSSGAVGA